MTVYMDNNPRRSERKNLGTVPKRFDAFEVKFPRLSAKMIPRSPAVKTNPLVQAIPEALKTTDPEEDPDQTFNITSSAAALIKTVSKRSSRSKATNRSIRSSDVAAKIRELEIKDEFEEKKLQLNMEKERIIAN